MWGCGGRACDAVLNMACVRDCVDAGGGGDSECWEDVDWVGEWIVAKRDESKTLRHLGFPGDPSTQY